VYSNVGFRQLFDVTFNISPVSISEQKDFLNKMTFRSIFKILIALLIASTPLATIGQNNHFDSFLRAGAGDANKLLTQYMEPIVVGFSYGMANSWYNTARTHKPLGFDLTITANVTTVPSSKEFFTFNPEEYTNVTSTGETNQIPTIMGPDQENGSELTFAYQEEISGETVTGSYRPTGLGMKEQIGYNVVPSPMIQLGVGTFKNTDIIIRYVPEIKYGDFKTSVFGLGIKHDIMQWVPGLQRAPIDISLLAAFSGLDNELDMSDFELDGERQVGLFNVNNWTIQAIVSKKISVLTLYGSVGYSNVTSSMKMEGEYVIVDEFDPTLNFTLTDPVNLSYRENSIRATGGLRLKFGPVTLHGDYTWQAYHIVSAGLGFAIR